MSLPDQNPSMVDGLRKPALEDLGLQPPLQEIFDLQGEHVIEPHLGLVEHTDAYKPADKSIALKETLGVFVVELEELTSGTANFGESQGNAPDLTLVAETILSGKL